MGASVCRRSALRAAFTLPTTRSAAGDNRGASTLFVQPAQMLDDPARVADRLAVEHEQRHAVLPGQRVDLRAVGLAPGDAALLVLDAAPLELACDATARAQPVGRRAAAVQDGGHGSTRTARPTTRHGSGWRVPLRTKRSPRRSSWKRTVASTVSSCG